MSVVSSCLPHSGYFSIVLGPVDWSQGHLTRVTDTFGHAHNLSRQSRQSPTDRNRELRVETPKIAIVFLQGLWDEVSPL